MAQLLTFLTTFTTIILSWTFAVVFLIVRLFPVLSSFSRGGYIFAIASSLLFVIGIVGANMGGSGFFSLIYAYGAWWLGGITIAGFVAILFLIVARILGLTYTGNSWALGFFAVVIVLNIAGIFFALSPKITEYRVSIPGDHGWHGKRIVMVADTHYGNIWGQDSASKLVERINAFSPEVVLIPGDFFDGPRINFVSITTIFSGIQAPQGVLFANGNHEEYRNTPEMLAALSGTKHFRVINNESVNIDGINFAGVSYHTSETASGLTTTLDALQLSGATILLKHKPTLHSVLEKYPIDLVVSGHTHRGQMWPFSLITDMIYGKYSYGLNTDGNLQSITTSGYGSWGPPQRLGTRSEIVVIEVE